LCGHERLGGVADILDLRNEYVEIRVVPSRQPGHDLNELMNEPMKESINEKINERMNQ
jgi:hypothetical protein